MFWKTVKNTVSYLLLHPQYTLTNKFEDIPPDLEEDKEKEEELIQAGLMMLQDISDSEDDE